MSRTHELLLLACGASLCATLIAVLPPRAIGAEIPCDQSPITYDVSHYPEAESSCDRTFFDAKEYDAAAAESGEFIAFLEVFTPAMH
jgi:hypothetical protein